MSLDEELARSRNVLIASMVLVVTLVVGTAWSRWPSWPEGSSGEVALPYVDALALCATDEVAGAAKIGALDALNGEDARPEVLRPDLARCLVDRALARVR